MNPYPEGYCVLYIDNSNIFINAQQHSASEKKFLEKIQDFRCRINIGKLKEIACAEKKLIKGRLYGSEPPALDSVWNSIRSKEIEVFTSHKGFGLKEKETDTRIAADATENLIELKSFGDPKIPRTFILFSGDRDMLPVVEKAEKYGWHVHIWSFRKALSKSGIVREARLNKCVKIFYIDDYFKDLCFYENEWKRPIPMERSIILTFDRPLTTGTKNALSMKNIQNVIDISSQLFQLPTQYVLKDPKTLALVVSAEENASKSEQKFRYEFNDQVWKKVDQLKRQLEGCTNVFTALSFKQNCDLRDYDFFDTESPDSDTRDLTKEECSDFQVKKRKERKVHKKYSDFCMKSYWCPNGSRCSYDHKKEEKEFFKTHPNMEPSRRWAYKLKPCLYQIEEKCTYKDKSYLCPYAHDVQEARCVRCQEIGVHWSYECPLPSC